LGYHFEDRAVFECRFIADSDQVDLKRGAGKTIEVVQKM
jgi:hypothetical protein